MNSDFIISSQWWVTLFILGIFFYPLTSLVFSNFIDKGYASSKALGILLLSYAMLLGGVTHILTFSFNSLLFILAFFAICFFFSKKLSSFSMLISIYKDNWKWIAIEEILFLMVFGTWAYIRSFAPDINGLEKFMDFGFVNSLLRSAYFPPKDMWFAPLSINYYYFGHLITAVLTKLSLLQSNYTYNLMIATLAGLTFVQSFSLAINLYAKITKKIGLIRLICVGLLTAIIITFAGNIHTLYAFFTAYPNDNPTPVWELVFSPQNFPNSYWYPNATRFIHNTIHEFPIYSWTVSDLHGHVTDIPFVLLTISFLFSLFSCGPQRRMGKTDQGHSHLRRAYYALDQGHIRLPHLLMSSLLLAAMYMTNAWDGLIYLMLVLFIVVYFELRKTKNVGSNVLKNILPVIRRAGVPSLIVVGGFLLFSSPFSIFFKPFVSGIGVLCAPNFLTSIGHIGPIIFETDHCQRTPWWQLVMLYGFFYFFVALYIPIFIKKKKRNPSDIFIATLIGLASVLIIVPEFIYAKDIYPAHYRANTMFKLVFQSFMILSLASGYIISQTTMYLRAQKTLRSRLAHALFFISTLSLLGLVLIFPYYSISSYYGSLKTYKGLDGTAYLKTKYNSDYEAIQWLNRNVTGQPVILEAQGDSYTDYARVSSNTGIPTVLGWTVHEWLWRGTYDIPAPRIAHVKEMYESSDTSTMKNLFKKYGVAYVFIGVLEKEKYKINEKGLEALGKIVFNSGTTKIYRINNP